MAGRPKQGIDYAGWSVNIFDGDTKIDKLLDAQGWVGFSIYFYLCQMAYKFDGYFYRWAYDDSASTARRMGGGIGSGTVEETVRYCLRIGLFDQRLFDEWNILTSKGIQRRYLAAIQGRRVKSVISDYWLLKNEKVEGLEKCASNDDLRYADSHLQGANSHLQGADAPKSKGKESKGIERERGPTQQPFGTAGQPSKPPTFEEVLEAAKLRGVPELARPFFDYYSASRWRDSEGRPVYSWQAKLVSWKVREDDRLRKQIAVERRNRDRRHSAEKPLSAEKKSFAELAREMEAKKNDI